MYFLGRRDFIIKFGWWCGLGFEGEFLFGFFLIGFGDGDLGFKELVLVRMGGYETAGAVGDLGNFLTEHN